MTISLLEKQRYKLLFKKYSYTKTSIVLFPAQAPPAPLLHDAKTSHPELSQRRHFPSFVHQGGKKTKSEGASPTCTIHNPPPHDSRKWQTTSLSTRVWALLLPSPFSPLLRALSCRRYSASPSRDDLLHSTQDMMEIRKGSYYHIVRLHLKRIIQIHSTPTVSLLFRNLLLVWAILFSTDATGDSPQSSEMYLLQCAVRGYHLLGKKKAKQANKKVQVSKRHEPSMVAPITLVLLCFGSFFLASYFSFFLLWFVM